MKKPLEKQNINSIELSLFCPNCEHSELVLTYESHNIEPKEYLYDCPECNNRYGADRKYPYTIYR